MNTTTRTGRRLTLALVGAMLLAVLPAGVAGAEQVDITEVCAGAPIAEFTDRQDIALGQRRNVDCMAAYGITAGREDGSFGPGEDTRRDQMASFIARMLAQATDGDPTAIPTDAPAVFDDVAEDSPHANAINWLADLEVTDGVGDDRYNPSGQVTRQQMATFIVRAHDHLGVFDEVNLDAAIEAFEGDAFTDIDTASAVHRPNIEALQALGVVGGFDDGTYRPGEPVTRQQMAAFIVRSAAVLDSVALWNGVFVVEDPEDPDGPETPDPDPEPQPEPTNQAYTLSTDETVVPLGTTITVTADVGDSTAATLWLLDADAVERDGQVVSFVVDDDGVPALAARARITRANGVAVDNRSLLEVDVTDGEVVFEVSSPALDGFVAVVTDGDADEVLEESGLADDDGQPQIDFGVSAPLFAGNITRLDTSPAAGTTTIRQVGTTTQIEVRLASGTGANTTVVPANGQVVEYKVAISGALGIGGTSIPANSAFANVTAEATELSGEVTTVDGVATITFTGPSDPATWNVYLSWEGTGPYDDDDAVVDRANRLILDYRTTALNVTAVDFLDVEQFVAGGGNARVRAEVVDQFGQGMSGQSVKLSVSRTGADNPDPVTLLTDIDGRVELGYTGPANARDTISAEVVTATGASLSPAVRATGSDAARVYFYTAATRTTPEPGAAGSIIGADIDDTLVFTNRSGVYYAFDYSLGETFVFNGATTQDGFEQQVRDFLASPLSLTVPLTVNGYRDSGETTVFSASTAAPTVTDLTVVANTPGVSAANPVAPGGSVQVSFSPSQQVTYTVVVRDAGNTVRGTLTGTASSGLNTVTIPVAAAAVAGQGSVEVTVTNAVGQTGSDDANAFVAVVITEATLATTTTGTAGVWDGIGNELTLQFNGAATVTAATEAATVTASTLNAILGVSTAVVYDASPDSVVTVAGQGTDTLTFTVSEAALTTGVGAVAVPGTAHTGLESINGVVQRPNPTPVTAAAP